jgi:hypothetical protein
MSSVNWFAVLSQEHENKEVEDFDSNKQEGYFAVTQTKKAVGREGWGDDLDIEEEDDEGIEGKEGFEDDEDLEEKDGKDLKEEELRRKVSKGQQRGAHTLQVAFQPMSVTHRPGAGRGGGLRSPNVSDRLTTIEENAPILEDQVPLSKSGNAVVVTFSRDPVDSQDLSGL